MYGPTCRQSFAAVLALATVVGASAQSSVLTENRTHAIVGAKIEIGNGQVIEKGNVILRNGIIVAVGPDAAVPAGAEVLDGKGLVVYPGFIDGYTTKGIKLPDANVNQDVPAATGDYASAFMRSADRKGVRPELQARNCLALGDDVVKPYRNAGFTTVMTSPAGSGVNGVGTLVNLSGRPTREAVVVSLAAMGVSYDSGFGNSVDGYPDSLLGRIAQVRQVLYDAQWFRSVNRAYAAGGTERPPADPTLEALAPLLDRSMPAAIEADSVAEIDRAFKISDEFSLRPILIGGREAYRRVDRIKRSNLPVILGLNVGAEPAEPVKAEKEPPKPTGDDPGNESAPPDPADRVAERKRLFIETIRNAATLAEAGIPFAFTTQGTKSPEDFMATLRKAVKQGLPRNVALRGLTVDPAQIFKVSARLGTLEPGKIANVTVMTGDFLDEKTKVKMLFVDGFRIDPTRTTPPPPRPTIPNREAGR